MENRDEEDRDAAQAVEVVAVVIRSARWDGSISFA
jgi:hypothetical protein